MTEAANLQLAQNFWQSPLNYARTANFERYEKLLQKAQLLDQDAASKTNLAYYFLQKVNTLGFINKIMHNELLKIAAKKQVQLAAAQGLLSQEIVYVRETLEALRGRDHWKASDEELMDAALSQVRFFGFFERDIRLKLYTHCFYSHAKAGDVLVKDLEQSDDIFVVLRGKAALVRDDEQLGLQLGIHSFYPGDSFGDMSLQHAKGTDPYSVLKSSRIFAFADTLEGDLHCLRISK
jgi:hypothetical protein